MILLLLGGFYIIMGMFVPLNVQIAFTSFGMLVSIYDIIEYYFGERN